MTDAIRLVDRVADHAQAGGHRFGFTTIAAQSPVWIQALALRGWRPVSTLVTVGTRNIGTTDGALHPARFEALRAEDADEVVRIGASSIRQGRMFSDAAISEDAAQRFYMRFTESLHEGAIHGTLFGQTAKVGHQIAGFAVGRRDAMASRITGSSYGYLWLIAIAQEFQGKGIGSALLASFLNEASSLLSVLEISTQATNTRALNLYLRAGLPVAGVMHQLHWHAEP